MFFIIHLHELGVNLHQRSLEVWEEEAVSLCSWGLSAQQSNPRDPEHPLCCFQILSAEQLPAPKPPPCYLKESDPAKLMWGVREALFRWVESKRSLGEDHDEEKKGLEGMKSKSQLIKYSTTRGWGGGTKRMGEFYQDVFGECLQ